MNFRLPQFCQNLIQRILCINLLPASRRPSWEVLSRANLPTAYQECWFVRKGRVHHGIYTPYEPSTGAPEHFLLNGSRMGNRMWIHNEGVTHWMYFCPPEAPKNLDAFSASLPSCVS
jgi:hypothetical protein